MKKIIKGLVLALIVCAPLNNAMAKAYNNLGIDFITITPSTAPSPYGIVVPVANSA